MVQTGTNEIQKFGTSHFQKCRDGGLVVSPPPHLLTILYCKYAIEVPTKWLLEWTGKKFSLLIFLTLCFFFICLLAQSFQRKHKLKVIKKKINYQFIWLLDTLLINIPDARSSQQLFQNAALFFCARVYLFLPNKLSYCIFSIKDNYLILLTN